MANPSNKESRVTLKDSGQSLRSSTVSTTENNANTIISVLEQQEDADLNVDEADDGNQDQENSQDSISMKSEPSPGVTRQSKPPARKLPWASRYRDASNRQSRAPLKTLSPNTPTVSRSGTGSAKRRRSDEDHGANAIHQLSEDGPKDAPQTAKKAKLTPQSAATSKVRGQRLLNLLQGDDGPAHKEVLTPKTVVRKPHIRDQRQQLVTPESSSARNSKRLTRSNSPRTVVPTSRMARIRPQQSHNKDEDEEGSPPPARPEDEPLRSRPLARLNLDDFKINPSYTGSDFAFSETIRGETHAATFKAEPFPSFNGWHKWAPYQHHPGGKGPLLLSRVR
ncbi:hypothetical protein H2203_006666 [Taxawa tesnikishii (nom. ined.)]|nr:hypothetical protein H2203_006666 [Dothideales sp. JES 119]